MKPGDSFENLDKKKFYLCTEKGQYANGFWLFDYRMGTLKWDTDTNKWFILAKRTCERKPRHLVNKATRLYDLRPGDTYYFYRTPIWVITQKHTDPEQKRGTYFRWNSNDFTGMSFFVAEQGRNGICLSYTVPEDLSMFPIEYKTNTDIQKAIDIIKLSIFEVKQNTIIKTESPFVNIEYGEIIYRYKQIFAPNGHFVEDAFFDDFRNQAHYITKVYYRGSKISKGAPKHAPKIRYKTTNIKNSRAFFRVYKTSKHRQSQFHKTEDNLRISYFHTSFIFSTYRHVYVYHTKEGYKVKMLGVEKVN